MPSSAPSLSLMMMMMAVVAVAILGKQTLEIFLIQSNQQHDHQPHAHAQHLQNRIRSSAASMMRRGQLGHL